MVVQRKVMNAVCGQFGCVGSTNGNPRTRWVLYGVLPKDKLFQTVKGLGNNSWGSTSDKYRRCRES